MRNKTILLILILLLSAISVFTAEEAIKIGDTIYTGALTSDEMIIRELDNTDKIEFVLNGETYHFDVVAIRPDSIDLRLEEIWQLLTANLGGDSFLQLEDGSKVYVGYITYSIANSRVKIWAEGSNVQPETEEETEEETILTEEATNNTEETEEEITNQTEATEEKEASEPGSFWKENWLLLIIILGLGVIIGFVAYNYKTNKV